MTIHDETRAPFAAQTTKNGKRQTGRTEARETPLSIRADSHIDAALHDWVYERMGRELARYAPQIERIQVRFSDANGSKGGVDKCCLLHVILSRLPPVLVEMRGGTEREAFALAAKSAARATRRNLVRHAYTTKQKVGATRATSATSDGMEEEQPNGQARTEEPMESLFGRHVGHGRDQLMLLAERPEKVRRDLPVDTTLHGVSASDRKVGYGHTGKRNTKLNTAGMAYRLEDSTIDRPTRKSSRGGNHVKADNPLSRRKQAAVLSPKSQASRANTRGH